MFPNLVSEMEKEEAIERLKKYCPKLLICGVRKIDNMLESVLVGDKTDYLVEVDKFSEYRTFSVREVDNLKNNGNEKIKS